MIKHLFLEASVLYVILIPCVENEIVANFRKCLDFFYMGTPPRLDKTSTVDICRNLFQLNVFYYATKYDTSNLIPVYSAYRLDSFEGNAERSSTWYYDGDIELMESENDRATRKRYQAYDSDYAYSGWDKGHLNPSSYHQRSETKMMATFVLTNAAPQDHSFNAGIWKTMEQRLKSKMQQYCRFSGAKRYFITGVIPGKYEIPSKEYIPNVNIPDTWWTAACCDSSSATNKENTKKGWSVGVVAKPGNGVSAITIAELNEYLRRNAGLTTQVRLFTEYDGVYNCKFSVQRSNIVQNEIISG